MRYVIRLLTICCLYSLLIAGFIPQSLSAQNTPKDTARHLQEINVNAHIITENTKSSVPVQTLDKQQLDNLNVISVADAAKHFSGVLIKDYGGIGGLKTISVRSLGANHTGVFYDGVAVNDIQTGQIDLSRYSLDNIASISLYNGQPGDITMPARTYTYAAALMMKSAKPTLNTNTPIQVKAGLKIGSWKFFNPSATLQFRKTKKYAATLSAEWQQSNGAYPFTLSNGDSTKNYKRVNSDLKSLRLEQDNYFSFNDSAELHIKTYFYNSERGLPGATIFYNAYTTQRLWNRDFFIQSTWNKPLKKDYRLLLTGKYSNSYLRYLDPDYLNSEGKLDQKFYQQEGYFSAVLSKKITQQLQVSYASDIIYNTVSAQSLKFTNPERYTLLNVVKAQFITETLSVEGHLLNTNVQERREKNKEPLNRNKFTPGISVTYLPLKTIPVRIRAFYKNIFRMPTFNDLYYGEIGVTNLKPELAAQYNLGLTWQQSFPKVINMINLSVDAYYNHVKDKIVAYPSKNLNQWSMLNLGTVNIKGIDVTTQLLSQPLNGWQCSLALNYTYQQAIDVTDPKDPSYKDQLPYTPEHSGSTSLNIQKGRWALNYNTVLSGYRYAFTDNTPSNYLAGWSAQDASLQYTLPCKKWQTRITGAVNNFLDQRYNIVRNFPMPGRSFQLGIQIKPE